MKLYRQAGNIKAGLFLVALLLIVGLFIYTQGIIEKLREENRETVSFHVKLFVKGIAEAEGEELDFIFREIIQPISFPIVIADVEGNPQHWKNLPSNDDLTLDNVREHLQKMAEENVPIPLIINLDEFGKTKDLELFIYFGDSTLISQLRVLPYIEIGMVTFFIVLGFIGFQVIRNNEKRHIWFGTARETAHQLGTPVSSLMGWLDRLVEHPEESARLAEEMTKDVNRLQRISDRFARMGSRPKLERIEVQQLLDETADYFRDRLPSNKSVTIDVSDAGDVVILGTPTLISWALENLVKNAIDSLDKSEGKVSLSAVQDGKHVVMEIADNGKGIRRRDWKNVFRPGYSTKEHGWGLGLSLVRRIIEEFQNGKVYINSSDRGVGTTFKIRIPSA